MKFIHFSGGTVGVCCFSFKHSLWLDLVWFESRTLVIHKLPFASRLLVCLNIYIYSIICRFNSIVLYKQIRAFSVICTNNTNCSKNGNDCNNRRRSQTFKAIYILPKNRQRKELSDVMKAIVEVSHLFRPKMNGTTNDIY